MNVTDKLFKVRPFEWDDTIVTRSAVMTCVGVYQVSIGSDERWHVTVPSVLPRVMSSYVSRDEAKAAAWNHYEINAVNGVIHTMLDEFNPILFT